MIECIIFDCDGTLVDSEYLCNLALEIKLGDYGIKASASEMMPRFRGAKLANILDTLEAEYQQPFDENFVDSYRALVDQLFQQQLQACAGVHEMLLDIDLPKCVASSGPVQKIQRALSITGLSDHFDDKLFSSYSINSWKPEPGILLHAAKEMGFEPRHCAVVDDSPLGIAAASAASMRSVLYDPENLHPLLEADKRIRHMNELKQAIA